MKHTIFKVCQFLCGTLVFCATQFEKPGIEIKESFKMMYHKPLIYKFAGYNCQAKGFNVGMDGHFII